MKRTVFPDYSTLSKETARFIANIVMQKPEALLCFPAGETSLGTFSELVKMAEEKLVDFSRCSFVGLDEWVHLAERQNENCFHFLKKHLFDPLKISSAQICFFNGESDDLESECHKTDDFIRTHQGIDLMLLGMGMNGHLGLNEPGTPFNLYSQVMNLDGVTTSVGLKYFSGEVALSKGITLGMQHIKESRTVILQVSGTKKLPVVKQLLESEVNPDFPASFLKLHKNAHLMLDKDAYA